jgi:hypothetical protein
MLAEHMTNLPCGATRLPPPVPTSSHADPSSGHLANDPALILVLTPAVRHYPTTGARARQSSGKT